MNPILTVKIKSLTFPETPEPVLKNINFTVEKGDFIAIGGGVAQGKSCLLHAITGAIPKFHPGELVGSIVVMGQDIATIPLPKMTEYLGYMMQDPQSQVIDTLLYEDAAFGVGNLGLPIEEVNQRVKEALTFVGLEDFAKRNTDTLSGGQSQRLVLAGILALKAPILILDQPTAELDPKGRRELYQHLARLNKEQGVTIMTVMDHPEEILPYANRMFIMEHGTIIKEDTPTAFPAPRYHLKQEPSRKGMQNILEVKEASYTYKGSSKGIKPISFSMAEGEFIALVGQNGSGKTTLLKMIEGLLSPTDGDITVFGEKMNRKSASFLRKNMGFLFQNPDLQIFSDTVLKEVCFTLKLQKISLEEQERRGIAALETMGLLPYKNLHPQRLSRGQRQLLALASMLIHEPKLIIADEPTSGLNEEDSHKIMGILQELAHKGNGVLLVSHDIPLAKTYCHRMIAMDSTEKTIDVTIEEMPKYRQSFIAMGLEQEVSS